MPHQFLKSRFEKQVRAIADQQARQFSRCLRRLKRFRRAHDLVQFLQVLKLFVYEQLGVTDNVYEKNAPYLKRVKQ